MTTHRDATVPAYLKDRRGKFWEPPAEIADAFRCPICKRFLWRAEKFWCCPAGLHGKAYSDWQLAERVAQASDAIREKNRHLLHGNYRPSGILRRVRRRQRFLDRNKLTDHLEVTRAQDTTGAEHPQVPGGGPRHKNVRRASPPRRKGLHGSPDPGQAS